MMGVPAKFLHQYLSPFVAGFCAAGATAVDNAAMMAVLLVAAALFCFASMPGGVRMIKRIAASR
jgi:hypothetical protein